MLKHLVLAAACAGLMACGGTESSSQPKLPTMDGRKVVSVTEMQSRSADGQVTVDMRNTDLGFSVEPTVKHEAVTVICPSGRVMNLGAWIPELASQFQKAPSDLERGFTMFPYMAPAAGTVTQQRAPVCINGDGSYCDSEREPDGSWTCLCGWPQ